MAELKLVLGFVNSCEGKVNKSCGLHVHHNVSDFNVDQLKRLFALTYKYQKMLYLLADPSRWSSTYCHPTKLSEFRDIWRLNGTDFRRRVTNGRENDRYHGVNFAAIDRHNTVEFRMMEGSINERKIEAWI